jgi:hypothetical protein
MGEHMRKFQIIDRLLRDRSEFFSEVAARKDYARKVGDLLLIYLVLAALYGAVMGSFWGWGDGAWRFAVADVAKVPMLFILTLVVCLPALYVSNVLLGTRLAFGPMVMLWLGALTVSSITLAACSPIVAFFMLSSRDYGFIMLLHVGVFAIAGLYGVWFLASGVRATALAETGPAPVPRDPQLGELPPVYAGSKLSILRVWLLVFAFVGTQMAWIMRPYVSGAHTEFEIVRPISGNFYVTVGRLLSGVGAPEPSRGTVKPTPTATNREEEQVTPPSKPAPQPDPAVKPGG